ncbi:hypothetical protein [Nocardia goodfellowii]|uniref:Uncharacterized protein n=1 Tax=Nocardia goodfellowii TaxID=882446 RepID=A0ABS4QSX0_9NOCA|nr:hypothetical protein [Nocardia goodfellowii]MBP2193706.1 hypothetical protein [Nocardia goodfellowii]
MAGAPGRTAFAVLSAVRASVAVEEAGTRMADAISDFRETSNGRP